MAVGRNSEGNAHHAFPSTFLVAHQAAKRNAAKSRSRSPADQTIQTNNMPALKNKIAIVTGGSSGIGLATAKRFVEEGAYVFNAGRRQTELDAAVAEIGSNVTAVKADVSKLEDLDHLNETVAKKGKIDIVFAGAAFVEKALTPTATPEHFDKTFNTNARGINGLAPHFHAVTGAPSRRLPRHL